MLIADTPNQVQYVRFCSLKQMVKLEKLGMKSRGGNVKSKIALELGLKKTAKYDEVIEAIVKKQNELLEKIKSE